MKKCNKKIRKRIAAFSGALLIGAVSLSPNVMAGDTSNTSWSYSFATGGSTYAAGVGREKLDTTSVYMSCTGVESLISSGSVSGVSYKGTAHGAASLNGTYSNISYNGKNSPTYTITKDKKQYLINYIKEGGKKYANIYCQPGNGGYLKFSGWWSPDSK